MDPTPLRGARPTTIAPGRLRRAVLAAVAVVCVALPVRARAQSFADSTLFAANNTTALYTMNRLTGAATSVGTLLFGTSSLARDPVTGRLYYTANAAAPLGRVAYYDPASSSNVLLNASGLNDVGANDNVVRLAFSTTGVLYGIGSTSATLYSISPSTGAYTSLGPVKIGSSTGAALGANGDIAFDFDGTAYVAATDGGGTSSLYRLSLSPSGGVYVATLIGKIQNATQDALAFGADGRLYSAGAAGKLYSVNKTSGAGTLVANGTIADYDFASSPRFADLSISGSTTGLPRGDTASFSVSVSNAGPQSATGTITVTDTLPTGLTYQRVTGTGWSCTVAGQVVTCTRAGPLAAGGSSALTLYTNVGAVATGTVLTSILRVTSGTIDQDQTNNRATVAGTVVADVDFVLSKTHTGNFTVGQNGVYTVSFTNTGVQSTTGTMTVTDTLPTGMTYVSGTGTSWTCSRTATAPDVVVCTRTTALASGAATSISLTVAVAATAAPARTNVVRLSGGGSLTTEVASDPTTINYTGVAVTPDSGAATQLPSNGTSYTASFTVTNTGNVPDSYTLAASKVPGTTLSVVSVNGTAGSSGTVTVAVGASAVVPVVYTVANAAAAGAVDSLKLLATSTSMAATKDPGVLVVTVVRAGLTMSKVLYRDDQVTVVAAGARVSPGEFVQFRVTVTATGTVGSTAVHVTDPVPSSVTYQGATGDLAGWTLTQAGGLVTADLTGTLAAGQSRFFWIRVKVN